MPSVNGDSITPLVTNTNATDNFSGDAPNLSPVAQTLRKITNSGCPSGSDLPVSGSADTQAANVFKEAGNIYTDKLIKQGLGKLGPLASSFAERLETTKKVKYLWLRHLAIVVAHQSKFIESQLEVCRKNQSGGNTSMRDLTMAHQILKELVDKVDNEITRVNLTRGDVAKAILKGVRSKVTGANNGSVLENKICLAAERMCSVGGGTEAVQKVGFSSSSEKPDVKLHLELTNLMKRSIEFAGGGKRFAKYCADQSLKRCQEEYKTQFPETSDDEIAGFDSRCFNEPTLGLVENSKEEIAKAFGDEPIALSILGEELEHLAFTPSCLIPPKRSPRPAEPSQPLEGAADQSAQQPPAATVTPLLPIPPADDGTHPIHPKHTDPGPTPPSTLQLPADSEEVKGKNTVICSPSFTIVVNGLRATDLDVQESDDDNKSSSSYTKKKRRPKTTIKNQDFKLDNGAQGNSPEDINFKLSDNLPRAEADISVGKVEVSKDTLGTKIYAVHMFIGGEDARHSDDKASEIDRRKKESLEKVADWMRKSTFGAPASGARRVILSPGSAQSFYGVAPVLEHSDARNSIEATDVRAIQEIADIEPGGIGIANRVAFFNGAKEFRLNNKFLNDRHVELENIRPKAKYGEPVD